MKFINKYLRNLSPYKVASHKIWEVKPEQRRDLLKLDWNEASVPPSPKVKERLTSLVEQEDAYFLYPSTYNEELMKLLTEYVGISPDNLQYFASSDALHEYLVRMFVSVGDPILLLGPTYDNFRLTCESQGGKIFIHEFEEGFRFNPEAFEQSIRDISPSLIYVCNPNNPSGNVIDADYLKGLFRRFPDSIFLIDEAYYEFYGQTLKDEVLNFPNLFISRTFSKAFALANFRAGYLISDKENIQQISKIRNPKNFTTFAQEAVMGALSDTDYMWNYVKEVKAAKEIFEKELQSLDGVNRIFPSEGNFLLIEFKTPEVKADYFRRLTEGNIFVRNLTHSKMLMNCLRITVGTREQMNRVIRVMRNETA